MKQLTIFTFLLTLAAKPGLIAQPTIEWQQSFGGTKEEFGAFSLLTADGGYILAGSTQSPELEGYRGNFDYWVMKLDNTGDVLWQKLLGGSKMDLLTGLTMTHDNGYLLSGITESDDFSVANNQGLQDIWLIKLDPNGNIVWNKTIGGSQYDVVYGVSKTSDNGFILTGGTNSNNGDAGPFGIDTLYSDVWFIKIDQDGDIEWQKKYGGTGGDFGNSINQTPDGGYIAIGDFNSSDGDFSNNYGATDIWIFRLDASGNLLWSKTFGGSFFDFGGQIINTMDGGFMALTSVLSNDFDIFNHHGGTDIWLIKMNALGNVQWKKTYGGSGGDGCSEIYQTPDGGYVMAGGTSSPDGDFPASLGGDDALLCKLRPNGSVLWHQTYGGESSDQIYHCAPTTEGGFFLSGRSYSEAGDVSQNNGAADWWIVKTNTFVSTNHLPVSTSMKLYPNPATDDIRFELPESETPVFYQILNAQGICVDQQQSTDNHLIRVCDLPAGPYWINISTESGANFTRSFQKVNTD